MTNMISSKLITTSLSVLEPFFAEKFFFAQNFKKFYHCLPFANT